MNSFDEFILDLVEPIRRMNWGEEILVFGGLIYCIAFGFAMALPWFRKIPMRFWVSVGAIVPVTAAVYIAALDGFGYGRSLWVILALSPLLFAPVPSVCSLMHSARRIKPPDRLPAVIFVGGTLIAQLWASLAVYLMTADS